MMDGNLMWTVWTFHVQSDENTVIIVQKVQQERYILNDQNLAEFKVNF